LAVAQFEKGLQHATRELGRVVAIDRSIELSDDNQDPQTTYS
jgi:hypothetical protein